MPKNYYVILGIPTNASLEQIRSAYRQQVKELHPDHYGEDSAPFRAVQEAYNVLSDPEMRRSYDRDLQNEQERLRSRFVHRTSAHTGRAPIEEITPSQRPVVEEVFVRRPHQVDAHSIEEAFQRLFDRFFRFF